MYRTDLRSNGTPGRVTTALRRVRVATTPSSLLMQWPAPGLFAIGIVVCNACTGAEPARSDQVSVGIVTPSPGRYVRLDSIAAPYVPIRKVGAVTLGSTPATTPGSIVFAVVTRHQIVLVDNASHLLRGYTKAGSQKFSLPTRSGAVGHLGTPMYLASAGDDSTLVVDLDEARALTIVTPSGAIARQLPLHLGAALIGGAQLSNGNLAIARVATPKELRDSTAYVIAIVNSAGKALGTGCAPDSVSRASSLRSGMYSFFRGAGVTVLNGRVYCRQDITPVVQVLSIDGRPVGTLNKAPPFYQRGADQPANMSPLEMNRFRSTWWEHVAFFPLPNGFVSIYASFDLKLDDTVYRLFACDSSSVATKCHTSDIPGTPVAFVAPDTLYVSEPLHKSNARRQLGIYVVSSH